MAAALCAVHLGARHEQAGIGRRLDGISQGTPEARPSGAALEFAVGRKKRLSAAGALEGPLALLFVERARSRPLGPVLSEDVKLLGRQLPAPFFVRLLHPRNCTAASANGTNRS